MDQRSNSSVAPNPGLEEARAIFDSEDHSCTWLEWVWKFKESGVFVNDRKAGVVLFARIETIRHGWPDVWNVWYASGPLHLLAEYFPHRLDFVCWMRHKTKRLHFTKWDRIRSLATIHGRKLQR